MATLNKVGSQSAFTDFFIAKLANVACGGAPLEGPSEVNSTRFGIYPNPASDQLYFNVEAQLSSYEVLNMLGQRLLKGNLQVSQNSISIESLSVGTYIVNFKTKDGKAFTQKIIKE